MDKLTKEFNFLKNKMDFSEILEDVQRTMPEEVVEHFFNKFSKQI